MSPQILLEMSQHTNQKMNKIEIILDTSLLWCLETKGIKMENHILGYFLSFGVTAVKKQSSENPNR